MDTWYVTTDLMLCIAPLQKPYYCPLKGSRQVEDAKGQQPYQRVDTLSWTTTALTMANASRSNGSPKRTVRLWLVVVSTQRTD